MSLNAFVILAPLIGAAPGLTIITLAIIGARRRKRRLASLHSEYESAARDATLLDVRYATDRRFKSYLKLFPWEMVGILIVRIDRIDAHLVSTNGKKRIALSFHAGAHTIEWKKPEFLRNGIIPWLIISDPNEKHYFTSETGATIFGSKRRTETLIERIQATLRLAKCRECEYLLWGNTTGICPECGSTYSLPNINEPRMDAVHESQE
ncbi:MAG: hypothetical protein H6819_01025 [Phycisphaerales bacterium]|nr:hypothetical protein [Phycisphaerales bacterium]MCB9857210.1 hypothetical protein [Phycisphaerales bacterium]MCB9863077.1 hypothetical protein [Phycisphaerales bacterium]